MSNMPNWLKEKTFTFRLKDMNVNPEFSIWKAWDKRSEVIKDPDGNEMKFPVRAGVLTNIKGEAKQVSDLMYMPVKDFKENFPSLAKSFAYVRNIVVDGVEYVYGFKKTANNKLLELCDTLKLSKQDPLRAEFTQSFDKSKQAAEMYSMKVIKTDLPPPEIKPVADAPKTEGGLDAREQEIMDAIKSVHSNNADELRFVEIMKQNGIEEIRAKEIFKVYKG